MKNKVEVKTDFLLEAHEAACDTWKKKLEKEFPDVFTKLLNEWKVYILISGRSSGSNTYYKLQRTESSSPETWVFASLNDSICWANGSFPSAQAALDETCDKIVVCNSVEEFFQGKFDIYKEK